MKIDDRELESLLTRELHDIAGAVPVPPMPRQETPPVGAGPVRVRRWIAPLAAAAAVLLVLAGVTVTLTERHTGRDVTDHGVPLGSPTVPFIVGEHLNVGGTVLPGRWGGVWSAGDAWVASRLGSGWWWGVGTKAHHVEVSKDSVPVLSRDGAVIALPETKGGRRVDVRSTTTGRLLGSLDLRGHRDLTSTGVLISAVTNSPITLILAGVQGQVTWSLSTGRLTILPQGHTVMMDTPSGMLISDLKLHFHLGTVDADGKTHLGVAVPRKIATQGAAFDAYSGNGWVALGEGPRKVPTAGRSGVVGYSSLQARNLNGKDQVTLPMPENWLAVSITWEDSDRIVANATPVSKGKVSVGDYRLVRCVVSLQRCAVAGS